MSFLKEFFKNKSEVGAVAPSSKRLGNKMYGGFDFDKAKCIVEFGPGTGVFTNEVLKRMREDATLIIFETNPQFYDRLKAEINDDRAFIYNDSAEKVTEVIAEQGFKNADYIISSLPLAVFPKELKESILNASIKALGKGGIYVQFQYSLNALKLLKTKFSKVKLAFTAINIPPAFVYKCEV